MNTNCNSKIFVCFLSIFFLFCVTSSYADFERIISLAPSITEEIYLLGAEDLLIGVTSYCQYLKGAQSKDVIGTVLGPNIEKIVSLKPDLILATTEGNRHETIEKLKDLGMNVSVFDNAEGFEGISRNFFRLSTILRRRDRAEDIIGDINERILRVRKETAGKSKVKVFWQMGARPIIGVSSGTFADEVINWAGGINIFADMPMRYPMLSVEEVIKRNPDIIIIVTMGNITGSELDLWRRFPEINAVKNNRIYVYDEHTACIPTPDNFIATLERTAELIREAQ